jgi:hypothetical protein
VATVFAVVQGRRSTDSASLDPTDPESAYFEPQAADGLHNGPAGGIRPGHWEVTTGA